MREGTTPLALFQLSVAYTTLPTCARHKKGDLPRKFAQTVQPN